MVQSQPVPSEKDYLSVPYEQLKLLVTYCLFVSLSIWYFINGEFIIGLTSVIFTGLMTVLDHYQNNFDKYTIDIIKFFGQLLFMSITLYLIQEVFFTFYNIIFYFGFFKTLFLTSVLSLVQIEINKRYSTNKFIYEKLNTNYFGKMIIQYLNLFSNFLLILPNYIFKGLNQLYKNYKYVNNRFIPNSYYTKIYDKYSKSCTELIKSALFNPTLSDMVAKQMMSSMVIDQMAFGLPSQQYQNPKNPKIPNIDMAQMNSIISMINSLDVDLKSSKSNKINKLSFEDDDLDALIDDVTETSTNVNSNSNANANFSLSVNDDSDKSSDEKKKIDKLKELRRKIKQKKMERTSKA
jgi:hypothetical protein